MTVLRLFEKNEKEFQGKPKVCLQVKYLSTSEGKKEKTGISLIIKCHRFTNFFNFPDTGYSSYCTFNLDLAL